MTPDEEAETINLLVEVYVALEERQGAAILALTEHRMLVDLAKLSAARARQEPLRMRELVFLRKACAVLREAATKPFPEA